MQGIESDVDEDSASDFGSGRNRYECIIGFSSDQDMLLNFDKSLEDIGSFFGRQCVAVSGHIEHDIMVDQALERYVWPGPCSKGCAVIGFSNCNDGVLGW